MPYFGRNETLRQRKQKPEVEVRNFHSRVKAGLYAAAAAGGSLLDLGAGRGADCRRYARFGRVVAVDSDPDALETLTERVKRCSGPGGHLTTIVADFTEPVDLDTHRPFDAVSLMFAAHYACRTAADLRTLAGNVSRHLRPGGVFFGVDMDGQAVCDELARAPDRCRWYLGWAGLALKSNGALDVTITSIDTAPKTEWLVDWTLFLGAMTEAGLTLTHTAMLDPSHHVENGELRAFSRLHRLWNFTK